MVTFSVLIPSFHSTLTVTAVDAPVVLLLPHKNNQKCDAGGGAMAKAGLKTKNKANRIELKSNPIINNFLNFIFYLFLRIIWNSYGSGESDIVLGNIPINIRCIFITVIARTRL